MRKVLTPLQGVRIWRNEGNKFVVFEAHYTADPTKRTEEYRNNMKSSMPISQYNQEFEIQWDSFVGKPVYPDFNKRVHTVIDDSLQAQIGLPLLIGVDFGLTPSALIGQLQENNLCLFDELVEENMGAERFMEKLKQFLGTTYPEWHDLKKNIKMFVDPSGFFRKDTDEKTCASFAMKAGFEPIPGAITWEERRTSVERWLIKMSRGEACFRVNANRCEKLVQGFEGGYRYPESSFELAPNKIKPIKDEFSHVQDCAQYICCGITRLKTGKKTNIPSANYSWGKRK